MVFKLRYFKDKESQLVLSLKRTEIYKKNINDLNNLKYKLIENLQTQILMKEKKNIDKNN